MSRIVKFALWAVLVTLFAISIHVQPMERGQAQRAAVRATIHPPAKDSTPSKQTPASQAGTALMSIKTSDQTPGGTHTFIDIGREQFRKLCRSEETAC
jgi:hypothetical protein